LLLTYIIPKDFLADLGCQDARTATGFGCNPRFVMAVYTYGPGNQPQAGTHNKGKWWRRFIIATKVIGKLGASGFTARYTFDGNSLGVGPAFTCPGGYTGLEAYTNYRIIVYTGGGARGHGWNKPIAWRDFQTGRHPNRNTFCG